MKLVLNWDSHGTWGPCYFLNRLGKQFLPGLRNSTNIELPEQIKVQ